MKSHRLLVFAAAATLAAAELGSPRFDAADYMEHVKVLAAPEMRGRASGSPELQKAADYIAAQFKAAGLKPVSGTSYFQPFQVTTNAKLGDGNALSWSGPEGSETLALKRDYIPFNFSSSGDFSGQVVFAGYGITAKEYNYDDYQGLDVKDKFVLVLEHEPQEYSDESVFAGRIYTEHSQYFSKAVNAKMRGAKGVIFVNDAPTHGGADKLEEFAPTAGPNNAGIPFVQVRTDVAESWFEAAGKDLAEVIKDIDADLEPESFALPATLKVTMRVDLDRELKTVNNVIGYLPGETDEHVVVGAHYDHLGLGEQYSMSPSQAGTVHPGADDNASGTAGVLALAEWFGSRPKLRRGILFMTYAGEELGLLGSSYYANHPLLPIEKAVAMINMDMIGRVRESKAIVGGVGTGSTLREVLEKATVDGLKLDMSDKTGYGSSDHTSFTAKQVPVLFFFSGLHGDYHKPSDTWDKVTGPETVKLLQVVARVTGALADGESRPQYVRVVGDPHAGGTAGTGSGYGPYFGSVPDFAEPPTGVRFSDVHDDSPAGKAGLKGGDILIEYGGKPIGNLYDFTYALRSSKVGDKVRVKVLRDGKPLEAEVTLEPRR